MNKPKVREALYVLAATITVTQTAGAGLKSLRDSEKVNVPQWAVQALDWWRGFNLPEQLLMGAGMAATIWLLLRALAWGFSSVGGTAEGVEDGGAADKPATVGETTETGAGALESQPVAEPVDEAGQVEADFAEEEASGVGTMGLGGLGTKEPPQGEKTERGVLVARSMVPVVGFKDRDEELAQLKELAEAGRSVIWVTGLARAGKTDLISRHVKQCGREERAARFELRRGADVQAFFEGVNSFLREGGEDGFHSTSQNPNLSTEARAVRLCRVLSGGGWVIVLDSFETEVANAEWETIVRTMQSESLDGCAILVGSRVMPEWGDPHAHVAVGAIEEGAGKELLAEAGAPAEAADDLFGLTGGLPGALETAGALARKRTAREILDNIGESTADVAERLLAESYEVASKDAQHLWAGLCLLPGAVTRGAARAMCEEVAFDDAWDELVEWHLLEPGENAAELHPLARAVGERRLQGMADWRQACGQRIAKYYADFAEAKAEDRDAIEAELENVLAAARLAFEYQEWEALWAIGYALDEPLMYAGRWTAREELLRLCLEGARTAGDLTRRKEFAHNLAVALQGRGDLEAAAKLYRESIAVAQEQKDRPGEAKTLHQLGMVAQDRGKLEEAEGFYKQSLEIEREVGDRRGEAKPLHQLGIVAQARGKLEEAEDWYNQSLEIEREVGNRQGIGASLHQLGNVAEIRGELEEAEGFYNQSLEIKREVGDRPGEAMTQHALAVIAQERGDWESAETECDECLRLYRDLGMRREEAMALHTKGTLAQDRGRLEEAEDLYKQSLEIEREVGDRRSEAATLAQMAVLAEEQGDVGMAAERMGRAVAMMEEMGMGEAGRAWGDLERLRGLREK